MEQEIIEKVIAHYGGVGGTQQRFGYKERMCVYNWRIRGLPVSLLADIHMDTGIEIKKLKLATKLKNKTAA